MRVVRAMTLNLRRDVPEDGRMSWPHRASLVTGLIRRAAPDVLGTQEGLPHQLAALDASLPGYLRVGDPRAPGDEACAIYLSSARFELEDSGTFWLSETPHVAGSRAWGAAHPRVVTWARVRERGDGRTLTIANTHLDHESEHARRKGAELLASRLQGAIVMGDLNAPPGQSAHEILRAAGWEDGGAKEPTYHGFTGFARVRIDHVLAPAPFAIRMTRVLRRTRAGVHASDHHAVYAEIETGV